MPENQSPTADRTAAGASSNCSGRTGDEVAQRPTHDQPVNVGDSPAIPIIRGVRQVPHAQPELCQALAIELHGINCPDFANGHVHCAPAPAADHDHSGRAIYAAAAADGAKSQFRPKFVRHRPIIKAGADCSRSAAH